MHSVQAAPRQRSSSACLSRCPAGCTPCRQRRGKVEDCHQRDPPLSMHSVQAAPRQRLTGAGDGHHQGHDALRAGSAEAKAARSHQAPHPAGMHSVQAAPRQRYTIVYGRTLATWMHSVQAAPRQSWRRSVLHHRVRRCTPCRQRRGKDRIRSPWPLSLWPMHSVQAAPRQRRIKEKGTAARWSYRPPCGVFLIFPLPNPHGFALVLRHYVQSSPNLFDRSSMAKQNLSHRANVICDGSPSRIRMVRRISLGMTTRPRSSIRLTMPVAFIYQIPPVDANVAQIVSACQRPAMQIFPVSCFWKAAPRKNAHAA